jgi:CDP-glycerol glycerophosphotransferase (TagB/SpsB family)
MDNSVVVIVDKSGKNKLLKMKAFLADNYSEVKIMVLSEEIRAELNEHFKADISGFYESVDGGTVDEVRHKAFDLTHNWFLDASGKDIFETDGLSFGLISQLYLHEYSAKIFLYLAVMNNAINKYGNRNFLLICKDKKLLAKIIDIMGGKKKTINYGMLPSLKAEAVLEWMKRNYLDWQVKLIYSLIFSLFVKRHKPVNADVVLVYDVYNKSAINILNSLQKSINSRGISCLSLAFEPRVFKSIDKNGNKVLLGSIFRIGDFFKARKGYGCFRNKYKEMAEEIESRFMYGSKNIFCLFSPAIDKLIKYFYAQLFVEYETIKRVFSSYGPKNIVAASDSHKISRLMVFMAKDYGVRSLVIQHGFLADFYAYVPVFADKIAVWGEYPKSWFVEKGVPEEKIVVTGPPQFNALVLSKKADMLNMAADKKRFLYAVTNLPSEIGKLFFRKSLRMIEKTLRDENNCELIVKLHPGEGDMDFARKTVNELGLKNVKICKYESLYDLISSSTAVLTSYSTVAIETLLLGKPLIIIKTELFGLDNLYEKYDCAFIVNDSLEDHERLGNILKYDIFNDKLVRKNTNNAQRFLDDYVGGNRDAIERVVGLLA